MAVIKVAQIGGIYPATLPRNLPDTAAQVSENLLARTGEFRPLATDVTAAVLVVANPKSLYRLARKADGTFNTDMSAGWRANAAVVNYAKAQIDDSTTERTYYTFDDGSAPPRAFDAVGADRQMGVPAPTDKLAVTLVPQYTFTRDQKQIEKSQAMQQVLGMLAAHSTMTRVGLADELPAVGWLAESDFSSAPDADRKVLRLFALDPATKAVVATYGEMPVTETAWLFDPALGGYYATKPAGYNVPYWAAGHSLWWAIPVRGFARAYDLNTPALVAALQTVDMPGTQGAEKWITPAESWTIADRLALRFDKDEPAVKNKTDAMRAKQQEASNTFNRGGAETLTQSVAGFYARADIAASIASSKATFAETIWRYAEMLGKATSAPWYDTSNTGGSA